MRGRAILLTTTSWLDLDLRSRLGEIDDLPLSFPALRRHIVPWGMKTRFPMSEVVDTVIDVVWFQRVRPSLRSPSMSRATG